MNEHSRVYDGATSSDSFKTVQIAGVDGLPTSGIGAVSLMLTVVNPNGQGQFVGRPDADGANTLLMIYGAGVDGNTSNTSLLAVGDDGKIRVNTQTSQTRVVIDVTGYYTSTANGVGAGGFVPVSSKRIVNTGTATNAPQGPLTGGKSFTFTAAGANGVPANAAAVAVNIIVNNVNSVAGWVRPFPAGATDPSGALNYGPTGGLSTAMSAQVAVGSGGKITIDTADNGSSLNVIVDVQGYFMPSNPGGGFTPQTGRLIDTRSGSAVASNGSLAVQIAGAKTGIPSVEGGLSAVAITLTEVHQGADGGYAKAWADGAPEPDGSVMDYSRNTQTRTTTATIPVGVNGKIRIKNVSAAATDFVVDLQGTYNSLPGGPSNTNQTGQRKSATTLPFPITDQTNASVDVGTGNLLVTTTALSLPGVTQNTTIGAAYNSRATNRANRANSNTMDANRWQYALAGAGDLSANSAGVVYTDAAGTAWLFKPSGSQGAFTTPAGIQQTLTRVNTSGTNYEYTLKGWTTNSTTHFNLAGQPTSIVDRNQNQVSFNTSDGYRLSTLVSTAGPTGGRTATSSYANGVQTFKQTSGSSTRSVSWAKSAAGDVTTYTDSTGKQTTFAYTSGDLTSITAPTGGATTFTYDSSDRVTQVQQRNTSAGSAGTAVTRFSYANDTTTQVADPRSDQSATVANAKHTTYTLDSNDLVLKAVDAAGRERSRTYNPANNGVATATTGTAGDAGSGTTKNMYGKNSSQSLTQSTSGTGSSSTADYGSGSATAYLPSKVTSSSSTSTSIGYDGVGNATSSQSSSDPAATSTLTYNKKGTDNYAWGAVKTATAPGNSGNPTVYAYDTNNQLGSITQPTGTSLGVQKYAYDDFGRVKNHTDGDGGVTTYTYDNDDRLLTTAFSDGTATVTSTYDGNGNQLTQQSATGIVTNTYDQRNRLTSTVNTAGGGTVSYGYDLAGNTVQVTDQTGTVTHEYDPTEVLTATTYPTSSGTAKQIYLTDKQGRRTDTWLGASNTATAGVEPASWAAHQTLTYDKSGKVTKVQAWSDSSNPTVVVDTDYCYMATTTAPTCTTSTANDRDKLQWSYDNIGKQATNYGYLAADGDTPTDRLTGITQTGGANPTNWAYTYDSAGNRTEAKATNAATGALKSDQKLSFNAVGQITTAGYSYDGVGNMTVAPGETYTYNGAQQLTASTKDSVKTSYEYAGADMLKLLHQATDGGAEYDYTYGTSDSNGVPVIANHTIAGTGTAAVISDPTTGQALDLRTTDGTTSMYVTDGIGNPAASIADTGKTAYTVSYDPYGAETISTDGAASAQWQQNPYGYKNGLRSSNTDTGLTKFGYRWQSSDTGGWIERDTLDAPLDPNNANRYAYAGADPINRSDPAGRDALGDGLASTIIAGVIGFGVGAGICALTAVETFGAGCVAGALIGGAVGGGIAGGYVAYSNGDNVGEGAAIGAGLGLLAGGITLGLGAL
ncbi:RHS repeat-associated core domain-containing protein [Curtobacterium sp. MCPF17_002]|uniref:beta strand repeat-containing protein n=1 Tax=Curtobacterium sp. MCPF17_002 TaxID=2175645 RepID=UPI0015E88434|nr:RHS repeat-associated core domain-containing protein [Curtobacterium sp. MCPF17_002]WIB77543.1 RHS repeat-associated core domain-containing protein [Curtobacterium sp. MCPF17_002]